MTSSGSAPPREALSSPSISSRLTRFTSLHQSQADNRTPTPSAGRRRQNSHLTSSLFQTPTANMALALSNLPPDYPGLPCKAGESYSAQWPISDLQALKEHVEGDVDTAWGGGSESMPEALQRGLIIGRGWFKLDLGRPTPTVSSTTEHGNEEICSVQGRHASLSLYIAATSLDGSLDEINYSATIFVGIKSLRTPIGSRHAETRYIWQTVLDYEFSPNAEFCQVQLPELSSLAAHPELMSDNGLMICVNIASPASTQPTFHLPEQIIVPKSTIEGLVGLIDSATGDVKFVCLEHILSDRDETEIAGSDDTRPDRSWMLSRKRVLYAHSEILKAACEFFHDIITGDYQEADRARRGDSRRTTILIDDAGFETVYWMLRFIYTNELQFTPTEDVRNLMDQLQIDRKDINRVLTTSPLYGLSEWDYRYLIRQGDDQVESDEFDSKTVQSVSSAGTRHSAISPSPVNPPATHISRLSPCAPGPSDKTTPSLSIKTSRSGAPPAVTTSTRSRVPPKTQTSSQSLKSGSTTAASSSSSPNSGPRPGYGPRPADPHPHPCPPPPPASALSIYMLSHRYLLSSLEGLAKDRIIEQMTPENCMPMLLATYQYEALHAQVLDYVISNWPAVQRDDEFLRCIQEVSAGIWGEAGGLVLHGLFQRL